MWFWFKIYLKKLAALGVALFCGYGASVIATDLVFLDRHPVFIRVFGVAGFWVFSIFFALVMLFFCIGCVWVFLYED